MADPQPAAPGSSRRVTFRLDATSVPERFEILSHPNEPPPSSSRRQRAQQPGPEDPNPDDDGSETGSRPFRVLCLSKNQLYIALAILLFGAVLSCLQFYSAYLLHQRESPAPWAYWRLRKNDNGIPRILLWNRIMRPLSFDLNVRGLHTRWSSNVTTCPLDGDVSVACEITDNRTRLMWSDAVVLEADRLDTLDLPSDERKIAMHTKFPMWILWAQDHYSPSSKLPRNFVIGEDGSSCQTIRNCFNWTMGHREDADVVVPYKPWRCGVLGDAAVAGIAERNRKAIARSHHLKPAAWIAGPCEEHSYQLMRYRHMNEEMDAKHPTTPLLYLDLIRGCGSGFCQTRQQCLRYIAANYYFIVVRLEPDCFHSQYELIYDAFEYDLVPVVLVPPNTTLNVPPHSVVSSADLQQSGELAGFLSYLMRNSAEYKRYFEWKKRCSFIANVVDLCPLCRALHEPFARQPKNPDAYDWWTARAICHGYTPPLYGLDWAFADPKDPWYF
ncbi:alpha-(1,3)-fucosyltransferase 7-like [Dermacentor andersoni]|uniref:alpha-(1,3)-fucosyltransferase 7-like n=1 Tax=Dermacentor andersoni TaxID=34620 RepID=UPI003B3AC8B1